MALRGGRPGGLKVAWPISHSVLTARPLSPRHMDTATPAGGVRVADSVASKMMHLEEHKALVGTQGKVAEAGV